MKTQFILTLCCLGSLLQASAQHIHGKVVDAKQKAMPFVSVIIKSLPDSTIVTGVLSKVDGSFELPAKSGEQYALTISYFGWQTINMLCREGDLGVITMTEAINRLDEVVVLTQRTKHTAGGYTVNLRSSDIVKGKQTPDALMFLPGVNKEEGQLKINGMPVSEIYVDGVKLTNTDELNNIPADMIDRVKVNYLAGSNQNASMSGGTIDITLRQPPKGGYYGSLSAGADYQPSFGMTSEDIGGVIYYRLNNLSIYNNIALNWNQYKENAVQTIWNKSGDLLSEIHENTHINGFIINNRLSLTQQLDKRNKISGSYYISSNGQNPLNKVVANEESTIASSNNTLTQQGTVKYSSALNDKGVSLDIIGDYYNRRLNSDSHYYYGDDTQSKSADRSSLDLCKLSIDLTHPVSQKISWKYGASAQLISSEYSPQIFTQEGERFPVSLLPTRTRGFIPHAYAQAMGVIWKLRYSVGVNWQLNHIEYEELDKIGSKFSNTQWGLNPTVQIMMPLDKTGQYALMLNYKRTLDDIPYAAISSTIRWIDPYNYTVGNAHLKAPSSDIVMAGVSLFGNKLNLTAIFAHANNNIYWQTMQSPDKSDVFYTTPINLPALNLFGVGAELNLTPVEQWKMKFSARLEITPEDATIAGVRYDETRLRQYYSMYNTFNLAKGWGAMLNVIYEPTFTTYDRTYHKVYNVGGKVYKSLFKDKLELSFIFNVLGDRRRYDRIVNDRVITHDYTTPVQSLGLSVIWRFSGGKKVKVSTLEGAQDYKDIVDMK